MKFFKVRDSTAVEETQRLTEPDLSRVKINALITL